MSRLCSQACHILARHSGQPRLHRTNLFLDCQLFTSFRTLRLTQSLNAGITPSRHLHCMCSRVSSSTMSAKSFYSSKNDQTCYFHLHQRTYSKCSRRNYSDFKNKATHYKDKDKQVSALFIPVEIPLNKDGQDGFNIGAELAGSLKQKRGKQSIIIINK